MKKLFWLFLISIVLNLGAWIFWWLKVRFNLVPLIFATGILIINFILSFFATDRSRLVIILLLSVTILIQVLIFALLVFLSLAI